LDGWCAGTARAPAGFTRNGHDWADRFPAIVDAALRIKASSFPIDGE
jgi:ATP-dependent DNA ligase